ncbi:MAG: hypothetical protein NTZ32_06115 [Planctomycetales bacterium]|nr:hypothetical protein [Planctomycetales bacterium]
MMVTATVETEGRNQTVRLPEGFLVDGHEVILKRMGRSIVLIPVDSNPWEILDESLSLVTDDFMQDRNQPPEQQREAIFE